MVATEKEKRRMVKNLNKSFELLKTVMELKLAYLKKIYPARSEDELIRKIHLDGIAAKEKQWRLQRT